VKSEDLQFMRLALRLARRAYGMTSPNPLVGAVLVKNGKIIGRGWHHKAGQPHAEIEALNQAFRLKNNPKGATLFVTLEPCSTHGRTPPCTEAIIKAGIKAVVIAALDPNPAHAGKALTILRQAGISVFEGLLAKEALELNEGFNHWIVYRTPFVVVKAAMSLDGKIATVSGQSKWITGEKARAYGMWLRQGSDAILVGVNTVVHDDPSLTIRSSTPKPLRRIILDPTARLPVEAKVIAGCMDNLTTVVVTKTAPAKRVAALKEKVAVLVAPEKNGKIDLAWLLKKLGSESVTRLLVEGGGETNALFLLPGLAHRIAFFYAPIIIGGRTAPKGVAGDGIQGLNEAVTLRDVEWRKLGLDLLLTARVGTP